VNFTADWFYNRRYLNSKTFHEDVRGFKWVKYLVTPWTIQVVKKERVIRVLLVEILFSCIPLWLWGQYSLTGEFYWRLAILTYLALVVVMDVENRVILHPISLGGGVLGLLYGLTVYGLQATMVGGLVGYLLMYFFYFLGAYMFGRYKNKRGINEDKEVLGFGDVNLSGVIGLLLGWPGAIFGIYAGILTGGMIGFLLMILFKLKKKRNPFITIPYAPFLVIGALYCLFLLPPEVKSIICP
jgi:leader peptidase (prepilin peptidase)/N-methyltransferase